MRKSAWTLYLWPGLPQLWRDGSWSGLGLAVGCGAALNGLIAASCIWNELLTVGQSRFGWTALVAAWIGSALVSRRGFQRRLANQAAPLSQDLFRSATTEYLKGHYYEAEAALGRLLAAHGDDVETRLFLATLMRRTRRYAEAQAQLRAIERLDGAAAWREEIARERRALEAASERPNWLETAVGAMAPVAGPVAAPQAAAASLAKAA